MATKKTAEKCIEKLVAKYPGLRFELDYRAANENFLERWVISAIVEKMHAVIPASVIASQDIVDVKPAPLLDHKLRAYRMNFSAYPENKLVRTEFMVNDSVGGMAEAWVREMVHQEMAKELYNEYRDGIIRVIKASFNNV